MISYQIKLEHCAVVKDREYTKHLFFVLIEQFNLHIRGVTEFPFYPSGLSIAAILAESHLFLHTYPDLEKIDLDFHYCGELEHGFTERFFNEIMDLFKPKTIKYVITDRVSMGIIDMGCWEPT
jgi:S-adenosylmethionine/arginine decarboxylase-like enzyme